MGPLTCVRRKMFWEHHMNFQTVWSHSPRGRKVQICFWDFQKNSPKLPCVPRNTVGFWMARKLLWSHGDHRNTGARGSSPLEAFPESIHMMLTMWVCIIQKVGDHGKRSRSQKKMHVECGSCKDHLLVWCLPDLSEQKQSENARNIKVPATLTLRKLLWFLYHLKGAGVWVKRENCCWRVA